MRVPIFLLGVVLLVLCVNGQFFPQQSQPQTAQFSLQLNLPYSGHPNTQQLANTWFSLMISQQFQLPIGSVVVIGSQPLPGNVAQSIIFTVSLPPEQLPSVTAGLMGTYSGLIQQQPVSAPSSALPFVGGQIFSATDADDQTTNSELDEVNLAEFDEALSSLDDEDESNSASVDEAGAESFSALSSDSQLALNPQQYVPNPQYSPLYVPPYQANLPGYTQPRPLYDPSQPPGTPQTATQQIYGPPNYTPYNPYVNVPTNPNANNPNPNNPNAPVSPPPNPNVPYNPNAPANPSAPFSPNAPVQGVSTGPVGWSSAAVMANNGGDGNLTVDSKWLIIGCSAGGGVLFLMLLIYCIFVKKRFKKDITDDNFTRHHIDSISIRDNFVYNPAIEIEGETTVKKDKNWDKYY